MVERLPRRLARLAGVLAVALGAAACCATADDGAQVRGASGSASAAGAPSAAASGSGVAGAGTGSASGPDRPPAAEETGSGRPSAATEFPLGECSFVGSSETPPVAVLEVEITLYTLRPIPAEVPAGPVHVVGINRGFRTHSIVVARFDGDPSDLPVDADGAVDVTQLPEGAVVGEISEFGVGGVCQAVFDLRPGRYVLFCYLVNEGESGPHRAHYAKGMHAAFTVT